MKKQKKTLKKQPRGLLAYHIAASLVSMSPRPHSGRSLHHRHTSHGVLLVALLLTGVLLFANLGTLRAYGVTHNGTNVVSVTVSGKAPNKGASINFPSNQTATKAPIVEVTGDCTSSTVVATYNKGVFAGSSLCSVEGGYTTTIPLNNGTNVLQSENYDALNQAGPSTPKVTIVREQVATVATNNPVQSIQVATSPADITPLAIPVDDTTTIDIHQKPCYDQRDVDANINTWPTIRVTCISRNVFAGENFSLPVSIDGGTAPFALSIDWGDDFTELKSITNNELNTFQHVYRQTGGISVKMKMTDAIGQTSFMQSVVAVNGAPVPATSSFASLAGGIENIWTEAPVPMYWVAVTLVVGFWIGDIFHRYYSAKRLKPTKIVARHRRV